MENVLEPCMNAIALNGEWGGGGGFRKVTDTDAMYAHSVLRLKKLSLIRILNES